MFVIMCVYVHIVNAIGSSIGNAHLYNPHQRDTLRQLPYQDLMFGFNDRKVMRDTAIRANLWEYDFNRQFGLMR